MSAAPILLLGATGGTGRLLVAQLLERGLPVRAVVRSETRARELLGDRVALVEGDLRERETLARAVIGCARIVFLAAAYGGPGRGTPREIDYGVMETLVRTVDPATVERIVLMSSAGVTQPEHPHNCSFGSVLKWKLRGEEALRRSGLGYTIVRGLGLRDRPGGAQGIRLLQGDRIAFGEDIARADVAAFLADLVGPGRGGFEPGFDTDSLLGATFEIFNEATIPGGRWVSARPALLRDAKGVSA